MNQSGRRAISAEAAAVTNEPSLVQRLAGSASGGNQANFITRIIQHQFTPQSKSLPSLLSRSLMAFNQQDDYEQLLQLQSQRRQEAAASGAVQASGQQKQLLASASGRQNEARTALAAGAHQSVVGSPAPAAFLSSLRGARQMASAAAAAVGSAASRLTGAAASETHGPGPGATSTERTITTATTTTSTATDKLLLLQRSQFQEQHEQQYHHYQLDSHQPLHLHLEPLERLQSSSTAALATAVSAATPPAAVAAAASSSSSTSSAVASFSDWWSDYWSRQPFPSGYTQSSITLLACLITTIIFLIVVGNLLVCIAIFTEKSLKPTQNWFIASLAVSDMLLGLVVMPFSLARELMGFWIFGGLWCDIHEALDVLLTTASINTLCLISLDRYWSITQAVKYLKKRTPKRGAAMIAFVWLFSAAVSLPPLFGWKKQSPVIKAPSSSSSNSSSLIMAAKNVTPSEPDQWDEPERDRRRRRRRRRRQSHGNGKQVDKSTATSQPQSADLDELAVPVITDRRRQVAAAHLLPANSYDDSGRSLRLLASRGGEGDEGGNQMDELADDTQTSGRQLLKGNPDDPVDFDPNVASNNNNLANFVPRNQAEQHQQQSSGSNMAAADLTTEYPSCQLSDDLGYVLYSALGSFYLPCAVMVFTYIKIFLAARSRARRTINKQARSGQANSKQRLAARRAQVPPGGGVPGGQVSGSAQGKLVATSSLNATLDGEQSTGLVTSCGSMALSPSGLASDSGNLKANHHHQMAAPSASGNEPLAPGMMKGKIVIVERRRSLAASGAGIAMSARNEVATGSGPVNGANEDDFGGAKNHQKSASMMMVNQTLSAGNSANMSSLKLNAPVAGQQSGANAGQMSGSSSGTQELRRRKGEEAAKEEGKAGSNRDEKYAEELDEEEDDEAGSTAALACTLTTSSAKQASPSALNSSASNDSSMITVMNASMSEVPVTRFNFQSAELLRLEGGGALPPGEQLQPSGAKDKAAALLRAISSGAEDKQLLSEVMSLDERGQVDLEAGREAAGSGRALEVGGDSQVPDIVVERQTREREQQQQRQQQQASGEQQETGNASTNETCFMTIEEDSDMFDSQAGRTIMLIAGNASQKQANSLSASTKGAQGITMTMMPAAQASQQQQQAGGCTNAACRHHAIQAAHHQAATGGGARSASSYCGSSLTINDDDMDDCVDDELLTDDCNGYSVSCTLDHHHYCTGVGGAATVCGGHHDELEGDEDDEVDDVEDDVDDEDRCEECEQQAAEQRRQLRRQSSTSSPVHQHLSIIAGDSGSQAAAGKQQPQQHHYHHHHQARQPAQVVCSGGPARDGRAAAQHYQHHCSAHGGRCDDEIQSNLDDNISRLTEFRSNEDLSSSIAGHDLLDATDSFHMRPRKKMSSVGVEAQDGRKRSLIGFRLARLSSAAQPTGAAAASTAASSFGLTTQSGGLLALASASSNQQQQQQQQQSAGVPGSRNLKALRQNFFLKLNQLTAKSTGSGSKQDGKNKKAKLASAQSSGTDHEASIDCATTSNVQSNEYPPETTIGDGDEFEQPASSGESLGKYQLEVTEVDSQQQPGEGAHGSIVTGTADTERPMELSGARSAGGAQGARSTGGGSQQQAKASYKGGDDDRALLLRSGQSAGGPGGRFGGKANSMIGATGAGGVKVQRSGSGMEGQQQQQQQQQQQLQLQQQQLRQIKLSNRAKASGQQLNHSLTIGGSKTTGTSAGRAYLASDNERHKRKLAKARERRATLILGLIMTTFICSWLPFFTFYVTRAICIDCRAFVSPRVEAFIFWAGYCNSAINPIIYTIFNRDFRKAFRKILFKCL